MIADAPKTLDVGTFGGATPWDDPVWRGEVAEWIDAGLVERDLRVVGTLDVRLRPWSVVIRIPVADSAPVWFKANPPGTAFESRLARALDRWAPGSVLAPVAVEAERGWALLPDGGPLLTPRDSVEHPSSLWHAPLRRYAQLQRDLVPRVEEMLALGVPDRRPDRLPGLLDHLLDRTPVPEVLAARERLVDDIAELAAAPEAATIDHGDLHDYQIFAGPGDGFRIFDWGDASVGHPFASLRVPIDITVENHGADSPAVAALIDAYLSGWSGEPHQLRRSVTLACRLASISRAAAWSGIFPGRTNEDAVDRYRRTALLRILP